MVRTCNRPVQLIGGGSQEIKSLIYMIDTGILEVCEWSDCVADFLSCCREDHRRLNLN